MNLKCKDYYIIKIRTYASEYYLKKFREDKQIGRLKHTEAYENYSKFFWELIEKLTGKTLKDFYRMYSSGVECAEEEILETHGIMIKTMWDAWQYYYIPKTLENAELLEWMTTRLKKSI